MKIFSCNPTTRFGRDFFFLLFTNLQTTFVINLLQKRNEMEKNAPEDKLFGYIYVKGITFLL